MKFSHPLIANYSKANVLLFDCIGYRCYRVKMSKQILNREKVWEIFLQNPLSQVDISKLTCVARSSVGFIFLN